LKKPGVKLKWIQKRQFVGTDSGDHSIVISSHDPENKVGVRPSDLLLLSVASCSAYDVVGILEKKRIRLNGLDIFVDSEQETDPPWTFRKINLHFELSGEGLSEKAVEQAIDLSINSYCSVASTISGEATISYSYDIQSD
jgi:putative redox protein